MVAGNGLNLVGGASVHVRDGGLDADAVAIQLERAQHGQSRHVKLCLETDSACKIGTPLRKACIYLVGCRPRAASATHPPV